MSLQIRLAIVLATLTIVIFLIAGFSVRKFAEQDMEARMDEQLEKQVGKIFSIGLLERIYHNEIQYLQPHRPRPVNEAMLLTFEIPMRFIFTIGRKDIIVESEGFPDLETSKLPNGFANLDDGTKSWRILIAKTTKRGELRRGVSAKAMTVIAAASPEKIQQAIIDLQKRLLLIGALVAIAAGFGGWLLGYRSLNYLSRLRKNAEQVRDTEDLSVRIEEAGPPEIKSLAKEVNAMLSRLEFAATEISSALSVSREFGSNVAH